MNVSNITKNQILLMFFLFFLGGVIFLFNFQFLTSTARAAASATIQTTITITVCGNNIKETGEQCDNSDLGGASCTSRGFVSGTLSCKPSCEFNTSACVSGGGGGGGGSSSGNNGLTIAPITTAVNFSGRAYPKSTVTLLKDAQVVATTVAGTDANFQINISGLAGGNYMFSVYSEDYKGFRSSLLTFPVSVTAGATTNVSGIFIAPTIAIDRSEVKKGDSIAFFGQAALQAEVTILVNSDEEFFVKTIADKDGIYLYNFDTSTLEAGEHFAKSKAALSGSVSAFSKAVSFAVGNKTVLVEPEAISLKSDVNHDQRINLVDFSITAFWYQRPNPPTNVDLNNDGVINLVDFSILAYYWTG